MVVFRQPADEQPRREPQGDHTDEPAGHHQQQVVAHRHGSGDAVEREGQIGEGQGGHHSHQAAIVRGMGSAANSLGLGNAPVGPAHGGAQQRRQVAQAEPEQIAGSQQLQGPEIQHPAGQSDQGQAEHQRQPEAEIERLALQSGIAHLARDRRQGDGVVRREHRFQRHQQGQQQQPFTPLIRRFDQRRQRRNGLRFHAIPQRRR